MPQHIWQRLISDYLIIVTNIKNLRLVASFPNSIMCLVHGLVRTLG